MPNFNTQLELCLNGHSRELDVSVSYEYQPAGGDGWNEPRYGESASVCAVETVMEVRGLAQRVDLMPLLTDDMLTALASDCCEHETEERDCRRCEAADWKRGAAA